MNSSTFMKSWINCKKSPRRPISAGGFKSCLSARFFFIFLFFSSLSLFILPSSQNTGSRSVHYSQWWTESSSLHAREGRKRSAVTLNNSYFSPNQLAFFSKSTRLKCDVQFWVPFGELQTVKQLFLHHQTDDFTSICKSTGSDQIENQFSKATILDTELSVGRWPLWKEHLNPRKMLLALLSWSEWIKIPTWGSRALCRC